MMKRLRREHSKASLEDGSVTTLKVDELDGTLAVDCCLETTTQQQNTY
jgi:hypothetical protein